MAADMPAKNIETPGFESADVDPKRIVISSSCSTTLSAALADEKSNEPDEGA